MWQAFGVWGGGHSVVADIWGKGWRAYHDNFENTCHNSLNKFKNLKQHEVFNITKFIGDYSSVCRRWIHERKGGKDISHMRC